MDAPESPARAERRWLPVIVLALVLAFVVFGGFVTAGVLSKPAGPPVTVAAVVRVFPLSGWELAGRFGDPPGARLTRGSGNLDFTAIPFGGAAVDLVREYVDRVLEPSADRLSVSREVEPVLLGSGLPSVRIAYIGVFGKSESAIEGEVTAVVSPSGVGVVFDGWAPEGLLRYVVGDVRSMIEGAKVA